MIYQLVFLILFLSYLFSIKSDQKLIIILNFFQILIICVFTGLRYEVGGDWDNYLSQYEGFKHFGFPSVNIFTSSDPLYIILCILSDKLGLQIYGVNFLISILFLLALLQFTYKLNMSRHFAFLYCSAYLFFTIFLLMGFSRQCLSISFLIFFLLSIKDKNFKFAFLYFFLSLISHKSVLIYYFFLFFSYMFLSNKFKVSYLISLSIVFSFFLLILFPEEVWRFGMYYLNLMPQNLEFNINQVTTAPGVVFKLLYVLIFQLSFFMFVEIKKLSKNEKIFFLSTILITVGCLPFLGYFSTLVDRIVVYTYIFIPFACYKIVLAIKKKKIIILFNSFVFLISFLSTNIWLFFSNHGSYWINYNNILFKL